MLTPAALIELGQLRHGTDWQRWDELTADAPPFLSPAFFALMSPLVTGTPLIAEAWDPERILGALPLVLEGDTLRALGSEHSPGYDYRGTSEGISAIWDCLRDDARWTELVLDKIPAMSLLATEIPRLARRDGFPVVIQADTRHPYLVLPGFEARLAPKFRTNVQRCARKAGDLVLERILVPTRAELDEALALEAAAWKGAAGTAIAADPRVAHAYHALARLYGRRGRASLYFLRIQGKRAATLFALEDRHTLYALKMGYDPHHAAISPGHLLIWKVAADAAQRGLAELDFVGREDEWKRKWTELVREHSRVIVYRRSPRGLARYAMRELIKPRLPQQLRDTPRSPLPRRCQHVDVLASHSPFARVRERLSRGLGIRSGLRRWATRKPTRRLGVPSQLPVGSWVRVRAENEIYATLDASGKQRGLAFVPVQLATCGKVYRVLSHVRRIRDDRGRFRPISRTVLLEGVDCSLGEHHVGCGRHCPLMYRDEWLEPAQAPRVGPPERSRARHARVRDASEIAAGLDAFGRRDGLTFMPEMAAYAGKRLKIARRIGDVFEHDRWVPTRGTIYILEGAHCSGALAGGRGPCDRACALMWHEDWLILEDEP